MRFICSGFAALVLFGCNSSSNPPLIELIIPKGFNGTAYLLQDPNGESIPWINGHYRIVIPADGILRVRSTDPLRQWHVLLARFDDGTPLPDYTNSDTPQTDGEVAYLGSSGVAATSKGITVKYIEFRIGNTKMERNSKLDERLFIKK